ncbi:MAG TPA: PD-(D/E)XK nuclease family protein [Patescibacteria group bacterium]|nr:PD-(D/E)XK nuclease family protein [Patescibacteria group bacterium]
MTGQFRASHYKIHMYEICPKRYYFEYLDEYTSSHKKDLKKPRPQMTFGANIHDVLKAFFKSPPSDRTQETMKAYLAEVWKTRSGKKGGFTSVAEEQELYHQADGMLSRFLKQTDLDPHIFYLPPDNSFEEFIQVPIDEQLILGGKFDRIDEEPDGTLRIIDYKTGVENQDQIQIGLYAILASHYFRKKVHVGALWYLKTGNRKEVVCDETFQEEVMKWTRSLVEKICTSKEYEPMPSKMCAYCDYVDFCPAKKDVLQIIGQSERTSSDIPF